MSTKIRAVALPAEHGGWVLIIEPIVLGLLVAPSLGGLFIGLAFFCVFSRPAPAKSRHFRSP